MAVERLEQAGSSQIDGTGYARREKGVAESQCRGT